MSIALVTGGRGFLGRAVAKKLKKIGFKVVGVGRGQWGPLETREAGFEYCLDAAVTLSSLVSLNERFQLIVHCAGNGSVGYSVNNPLEDFLKTVQSTAELLEYMRVTNSEAFLVYPSSAGVYGAKRDKKIRETDSLTPISPYGYHKKITEDLLASYSKNYGIRIGIIRFFSIYGPHLTKQLLWDASEKLMAQESDAAIFWGTGEETRDWIHCDDAAELIYAVSNGHEPFSILNGASGTRTTVRTAVAMLQAALGTQKEILFNKMVRKGDPQFYWADIERSTAIGWKSQIDLTAGITEYAKWLTKDDCQKH